MFLDNFNVKEFVVKEFIFIIIELFIFELIKDKVV